MWLNNQAVALCLLQIAFETTFVASILLLPQNRTSARLASVTVLSALSYALEQECLRLMRNPHWRAIAAPLIWIQLLSASDMVLVERASSLDFRPQAKNPAGFLARNKTALFRVLSLLWNLRRVGTRWAAKNTPAAPQQRPVEFVCQRAATVLVAYLVLNILVSAPAPDAALIGQQKESLWNMQALSREDIIFRVIGTVSFWISVALLLLIISKCGALLGVISGCCGPEEFPPLFGSLTSATSIRQFWGVTWHQCLRTGLTGHANLVAASIFRIPHGTTLSVYIRLLLAFLLSGLVHYRSDIAMGIERSDAGSFLFFSLQALGIMVEDGFQYFVARLSSRSRNWIRLPKRSISMLGGLWVSVFLVWTTPTWFYPQQRLDVDPAMLLPISVVRTVVKKSPVHLPSF
ncbi:hypothetical protein LZ32DRAFT_667195 [Colletotrichum eremochloae]|nr:hypothetical protein LZ32DRAFT_667195 [Colletotrichum eremochloae]